MATGPISELHFIAPIENLVSIFTLGILSHNDAEPYKKADVSLDSVQQIRSIKVIPTDVLGEGRTIHDCANVYFNAKNPMLSLRRNEKETLTVLRLKPELLAMPEAVISDRNAAVKEARFFKAATGVNNLAMNTLFGEFWTSKYNSAETNKVNGQLRCAELLVPHSIHPSYIGGMYVASEAVKKAVIEKFPDGCPVSITIYPSFFFGEGQHELIQPLSNQLFPHPINYTTVKAADASLLKTATVVDLTIHKTESIEPAPSLQSVKAIIIRPQTILEQLLSHAPVVKPMRAKTSLPAHMTMITEGNLLESQRQTLVNTVNCKGVMGIGIAAQFKKRYPAMFDDYKTRCEREQIKPGVPYMYTLENGRIVINFPTKDHWKDGSQLLWIEKGLELIKRQYKEWGITSIAIPPLGCGHGGLDWNIVRPMIIGILSDIEIPVDIFCPIKA